MATYRARVAEFVEVLSADNIDIKRLRKLCFNGCPHESGIRAKSWKLLLHYLPPRRSEWQANLNSQRQVYREFIDEMIIKPGSKQYESNRTDVTMEDHPLNPNPDSTWSQFFKDNEMLVQIDKDCRRLCPDLAFFQSPTAYPCMELMTATTIDTLRKRVEHSVLKSQAILKNRVGITLVGQLKTRKRSEDMVVLEEGQEAHWEVAARILFLYGKLNPGQGYVQGMNEILGPLYHTFATDPESQEHAEADAFFCFTNLMAEIRDNFIKSLDDSSDCGITYNMRRVVQILKQQDTALWCKLQQQDMKPEFYAFRWITLLLSQEFPLPDVLRVWDSLLSDINRFDFLLDVCVAMLVLLRDDLLKGDFPNNMKLIQNYPLTDIQVVLSKAVEISRHYRDRSWAV